MHVQGCIATVPYCCTTAQRQSPAEEIRCRGDPLQQNVGAAVVVGHGMKNHRLVGALAPD